MPAAEDGGESVPRPAYYAARSGGWRDWWTLLHPPYTLWHLSYPVIGAALAPRVQTSRLIATVLAFFLAVGLAAHALDELRGRPLRTRIPAPVLVALVVVGLAGALGLGVAGVSRVGWTLIPFMVAGPVLVIAYNAELFGGVMHTDFGFAAGWGAFPVLTAYVAQAGTLAVAPVLAAFGAFALSSAQRRLKHPGQEHPAPGAVRRGQHHLRRRPRDPPHRRRPDPAPRAGPAGHLVGGHAARRRPGRGSPRLRRRQRRLHISADLLSKLTLTPLP